VGIEVSRFLSSCKGSFASIAPLEGHIIFGEVVQQPGHMCKVLHKGPIVRSQSAEHSDFLHVRPPRPTGYGGYLVGVTFDHPIADNMTKDSHLALEQTIIDPERCK